MPCALYRYIVLPSSVDCAVRKKIYVAVSEDRAKPNLLFAFGYLGLSFKITAFAGRVSPTTHS